MERGMMVKGDFELVKQLYADSRTGKVPKSVLLSGEEEYPLISYIKQLKSIVPLPELNITEYRDVFHYDNVRNSFDTLPMMSDFRLVILNKTGFFKWNKDERFHALFCNIPDHIRLIVFETDLNKTSSNYKKFEKTAIKIILERADKKYLSGWIKKKCTDAVVRFGGETHFRMDEEAIQRLADFGVDKGMFFIKNAIDYFAASDRVITAAEVESYLGEGQKNTVWALYENITSGHLVKTVIALLEDGEDEFEMFGRISSVVRSGLKYQKGTFEGTPYMTKIASKSAGVFGEEDLHRLIQELSITDIEMKSTGASKKNLLVQICMKIDECIERTR